MKNFSSDLKSRRDRRNQTKPTEEIYLEGARVGKNVLKMMDTRKYKPKIIHQLSNLKTQSEFMRERAKRLRI